MPATSQSYPDPTANSLEMTAEQNTAYLPNLEDSFDTQNFPQYPGGIPATPDSYPPANLSMPAVYPGQPVPTGYPPSQPLPPIYPGQTVPPVYPGQPAPSGQAKSRRGLIVTLCVLLTLALCALGITVYKLFIADDSLAVGVKPAWDKPAQVEINTNEEPGLAYTLYWPDKDKLILVQPFKNGSGIGQLLDPKTGAKTGGPIALPKCDNSFKYPFSIKDGKIVCATKDTTKTNQNKKYRFNEQIYADKHLIVGASPSATHAKQIVAYNPKTSKLIWAQNLKKPASVTCDGKGIYTTFPPDQSSTADKQKLNLMLYNGSSQPQEAPEKQLQAGASALIAPDAIKKIDFANTYLPITGDTNCNQENFWRKDDGTPILRKMPSETTPCWATMKNGKSVEQLAAFWDENIQVTAVTLEKIKGNVDYAFDSKSFVADLDKSYAVGYGDVDGDGYLDAEIISYGMDAAEFNLAIFDPEDPEHPYLSVVGGTQDCGLVKIVKPGQISIYCPAGFGGLTSDKVDFEMSIKGREITDYVKHF